MAKLSAHGPSICRLVKTVASVDGGSCRKTFSFHDDGAVLRKMDFVSTSGEKTGTGWKRFHSANKGMTPSELSVALRGLGYEEAVR